MEDWKRGLSGLAALSGLTQLVLLCGAEPRCIIDLALQLPGLQEMELRFGRPILPHQAVRA